MAVQAGPYRILFVCTGNIFRSLTADVALRKPDIEDVIPDYRANRPAVEAHVRSTIDRILELAPAMAGNIVDLIRRYP